MEREELSAVCHSGLPFANPLGEEKVVELIGALALGAGSRVLDVGAGNGEILRRIVARYGVRGIGLDPASPTSFDERTELRRARIEELTERDFDLVVNVAASHAFGRWHEALEALSGLVRPGGLVLFGEGYWRRPPTEEYLDALGGATEDELSDYSGLMSAAEDAGLTPLYASVASDADWDRYEWTQILNSERHGHPALRERAQRARRRLTMAGGRDTLGFALVLLTRNS